MDVNHGFGLSWTEAGKSEQGRSINYTKWGEGPTKILVWSQMHGNEATGTLALLEVLNHFNSKSEGVRLLKEQLTIYWVPMLNPDGSEVFTRRNALHIDNNRDFIRFSAKESQCIKSIITDIQPDIAINLHDQRDIFGAEKGKPATISFLAPSFNEQRAIDLNRERCMRYIAIMNRELQKFIPGSVGRYTDEYYPAAIGEYVQKQGIPCILIESGAASTDMHREVAREMNVRAMLSLFESLARAEVDHVDFKDYFDIPENNQLFYSIIIRNLYLKEGTPCDLGIIFRPFVSDGEWVEEYVLEEIGDLSYKYGLEEYDARGYTLTHPVRLAERVQIDIPGVVDFKNGKRL